MTYSGLQQVQKQAFKVESTWPSVSTLGFQSLVK